MDEKDFTEFGKKIGESVKSTVNSKCVTELINNIDITVREVRNTFATNSYRVNQQGRPTSKEPAPPVNRQPPTYQQPAPPPVQCPVPPPAGAPRTVAPHVVNRQPVSSFTKGVPRGAVSSVLMLVFGFILAIPSIPSAIAAVVDMITGHVFPLAILPVFSSLTLVSLFLIFAGFSQQGQIRRYKIYRREMLGRNFSAIKQLASCTSKTKESTTKELKKMIRLGMITNAHIDDQETCLMIGDEIYQMYLKAQETKKQREKEEAMKEQRRNDPVSAGVQSVIDDGEQYLNKIKSANDAIPDPEISEKLDRLEQITSKIFHHVEQHPKKLPEIRKFMSYYMPTTLKLVEAYREFDQQPVQGENIKKAKVEISDALNTVNAAFENLLDSLFEDDAFDVSTDISVLEAMLAQEGLTDSDFKNKDESK